MLGTFRPPYKKGQNLWQNHHHKNLVAGCSYRKSNKGVLTGPLGDSLAGAVQMGSLWSSASPTMTPSAAHSAGRPLADTTVGGGAPSDGW